MRFYLIPILLATSCIVTAQTPANGNEQAATSAEAERNIMEKTLAEILAAVGKDSDRGKMFLKSQNEWVQYVKEQAKADADGVSGNSKYPQSYFQSMRELTRYRTRILEGCLSRLEAESIGGRGDVAAAGAAESQGGGNSSARDWKGEVGDNATADAVTLYEAQLEGVDGILSGQWRGDDLWRGVFLAERGDAIVLYGGKMERGGIVFEAWQEGTRIGRGFAREEDGDLRGRFFDDRRRESPVVLKARERPNPVSYNVAGTAYSGLIGTEEAQIALEWHDTRFVRGTHGENVLVGHNYAGGKLSLVEKQPGENGSVVAFWSLGKKKSGSSTRWVGQRKAVDGPVETVDFGR